MSNHITNIRRTVSITAIAPAPIPPVNAEVSDGELARPGAYGMFARGALTDGSSSANAESWVYHAIYAYERFRS